MKSSQWKVARPTKRSVIVPEGPEAQLPGPGVHIMSDEITPVVFRRWRDTGDLIALFPTQPADYQGWFVDSYMHVGQHAAADFYGVVRATTPASPVEAADLIRELERIGYRLKVIKRASWKHHEARRATARSLR